MTSSTIKLEAGDASSVKEKTFEKFSISHLFATSRDKEFVKYKSVVSDSLDVIKVVLSFLHDKHMREITIRKE